MGIEEYGGGRTAEADVPAVTAPTRFDAGEAAGVGTGAPARGTAPVTTGA